MRGRGLHLDDDVPIVTPTVPQIERPADAAEAHMSMGKMELISNAAAKMMNAAVKCELTCAEVWTLAKTAIELFGASVSRFANKSTSYGIDSTLIIDLTARRAWAKWVSNSGKSAVGPAAYRLTLSNRPSSTSCFPSALNASFTNLGECIDAAIISFRPINRTRRFSPACSLASNVASLELLVAHLVFPRTAHCHHQSTPNASDTSDPAPSVPFHHSAILASLAYSSLARAPGARAKNVYP